MAFTNAERQSRYRDRHPERIAKAKELSKDARKAYDAEYRSRPETKLLREKYNAENSIFIKENKRLYHIANREKFVKKAMEWEKANPERTKLNAKNYRENNKDKERQRIINWKLENPEKRQQTLTKYRLKNLAKFAAKEKARQCEKQNAIPGWANLFFIEEIYDLSKRRTECLHIKYHVDHIVPLKSKLVCGLHVEHNLQVIVGVHNMSKGNRFWPDMP